MKKIFLYLKTHESGLRYLGKTVQDPFTYTGSGLRWKRHLAKHGNNVTTQILFESYDPNEIATEGLYYSELLNIVNDKNFANLRPESGDGGDTSMCDAYKVGIKKRDVSGSKNSMYGRSAVVENNLKWYNDGTTNIYVTEGAQPADYVRGRIITFRTPLTEETKQRIRDSLIKNSANKRCSDPAGTEYSNVHEASLVTGMKVTAIRASIGRGKSGWRYL